MDAESSAVSSFNEGNLLLSSIDIMGDSAFNPIIESSLRIETQDEFDLSLPYENVGKDANAGKVNLTEPFEKPEKPPSLSFLSMMDSSEISEQMLTVNGGVTVNNTAASFMDVSEISDQISITNGEVAEKSSDLIETKDIEDEEESTLSLDEQSFFQKTLIELGRCLWKSTFDKQHYTKGCLWSPDGTCLLVPVHLDGMHVLELPRDLYSVEGVHMDRAVSQLTTAVHVKEGGTVYDFVWYPFMNSEAPESCCWLATRQHEPIHLWDAFTGELRCTYRGYDNVDEVEAAISVIFSNDGEKVIGGYKKSIKIFDTNTPGRDYLTVPVKKAVSCFALTEQSDLTVTTGSWYGYIDHYDLRVPKFGSLFTLRNHTGGITWLKYSRKAPLTLFSGARRDNQLLQWDMRNYKEPVRKFERSVTTNQRIYFDLSPQEQWLVSGGSDGLLRIWDLSKHESEAMTVPIHKDCCNGVNFHPTLPILATSAGQYHFVDIELDTNDRTIVKYENSTILLGLNAIESNREKVSG